MKLLVFLALCLIALSAPATSPRARVVGSALPVPISDQISAQAEGIGMNCCVIGSCGNGCVPSAQCLYGCLAPNGLAEAALHALSSWSLGFVLPPTIDPVAINLPPDPHPPRT